MKQGQKKGLRNKYSPPFLILIMLLFGLLANGQAVYNPSTSGFFITTNKPLGLAQAAPPDGRSMKLDSVNGLFRPYNGTAEVLSYLPSSIPKYRQGNFIIVVDSGGVLQPNGTYVGGVNTFWMFRTGTTNSDLVELNLFGSSGCVGCLLSANNLNDVANAGTSRANLGLGSMSTQNIAASGDLSGNWPSLTVAKFNGQLPSYYLNYLNLTNVPAIPPQLNPTQLGQMVISGTYPNLSFNSVVPGFEQTLLKLNTTSQADSIVIGSNVFSIFGTSAVVLPSGTTAQRPGTPAPGMIRYNYDSAAFEYYSSAWHTFGSGGGGGSGGITALTGDGTASGTGSVPFTLATVNSNVFGSNTFLKIAVNGKGLTTSAVAVGLADITAAQGFQSYPNTNPNNYIAASFLSGTAPIGFNAGTGVISLDTTTLSGGWHSKNYYDARYLQANQTITLSGDVAGSGTTAITTTIQSNAVTTSKINNAAVTYAKIQNAAGSSVLLGAQSPGTIVEVTLGTNLSMTGGVLNATTAGAQTLTYTQNALNNNLAISGGNSQNFLPATHLLAGLLDTARATYLDSLKNGLKTFNITTLNGVSQTGGDTLLFGGSLTQNTTLATTGFDLLFTGLPHKATTGTDSLMISDALGKIWKTPLITGGITQLTGDVTAGPGSGSQAAAISALAVTTGKIAANAVTLGKMSTNVSNSLLGYDGSGNPADITAGTNITISGGVISATGGGGSSALDHNPLNDTLRINGVNATPDNDNPFSTPHQFRYAQKNFSSYVSQIADTTGYPAGSDSAQAVAMIWSSSFGEGAGRYGQHMVTTLKSRYHLPCGGPGFIGGLATGVYGYGGIQTNGWTTNSAQTSTKGRGPDGYSWIGTNGDTLTFYPGPSSADYLSFTNLTVMYYDTSAGGSFTVKVDGTVLGTINTATGTAGFNTFKINGLSANSHRVTFTQTTSGYVEVLGVIAFSSGKRSFYVENCSQGGIKVSDFVNIDPTLQKQELQALNPNLVIMDNGTINSIKALVDTTTVGKQTDTLVNRVKIAIAYVDISVWGPTDYGYARWGTPLSPIASYTRTLERVARRDTVNFFDFGQIVGPFQFGITHGTITTDSLHPFPQAFNTGVNEYFNLNGSLASDTPQVQPNIFQNNGSLFNNSTLGPYRYLNFANVGQKFRLDSLTNGMELDGPSSSWLNIAPTGPNNINLTNSGGSAGSWKFDGNVQTATIFNSTGTGTNLMSGKLAVGTGGSKGNIFDVHMTTGNAIGQLTSDANSGFNDWVFQNNAVNALEIITTGSSSGLTTPLSNSSVTLYAENGNFSVWQKTNNPLIFGSNNLERARFFGGGDFGIQTTTDSSAYVHIGAGSTTKAPLKLTASSLLTTPVNGAIEFDGTNYYGTAGGTRTALGSGGLSNPMTTTGDIIYSSSGSTPARLGIGTTGQVLTVSSGIPSWATPSPSTKAKNDQTGFSPGGGVIVNTYTPSADGTYRVGGYITVTAVSADVIKAQVSWTDETNTARTVDLTPIGAGSSSISSTGAYIFPTVDIRVKSGTTINFQTATVTGTGTMTFDAGGNIQFLQ